LLINFKFVNIISNLAVVMRNSILCTQL